jgi:hypothetical protein
MTRTRRDRSQAPKGGTAGSASSSAPSRASSKGGRQDAGVGAPFTRWTGIFGGGGVVVALAGFYFLAQGSIGLAPFLLAVAFLVLFPLALAK